VPVISIGNLTVGGTGKTPIVIEVTQWLLAAGKRVAVLSRGYRRTSREPFLLVSDGAHILTTPEQAGDEPSLIAQRCRQAVVAVGADRYRSGLRVLERTPVDCIVLDDGFQHLGLHRDVDLLLVDATDANGLTQVLPAGRLREPLIGAKRATAVIVTRAETAHQVDEVVTRLRSAVASMPMTAHVAFRAVDLVPLSGQADRSWQWCRGKRTLLVTGIGHPASFRATAEQMGVMVLDEAVYPDHYWYGLRDVALLEARADDLKAELVLTTEKDAGKIRPHLTENNGRWWAARLGVEWLTGEAEIRKVIAQARPAQERGPSA
jgi:tetraacyldisaccharide 4'-kinase